MRQHVVRNLLLAGIAVFLLLGLGFIGSAMEHDGYQASNSLKEAREHHTLVRPLRMVNPKFQIANADGIIEEMWVEYRWEYAPYGFFAWLKDDLPIKKLQEKMVVVKFKSDQLANSFFLQWEFGLNRQGGGGRFGGCTQAMGLSEGVKTPQTVYVLRKVKGDPTNKQVVDSIAVY
jgi:hypothetical protein